MNQAKDIYPDPIDAIQYLMEENGWKNKDLEQFMGAKGYFAAPD
jgi:antitoxin component HigA of HigAB toxin-antitoxin module